MKEIRSKSEIELLLKKVQKNGASLKKTEPDIKMFGVAILKPTTVENFQKYFKYEHEFFKENKETVDAAVIVEIADREKPSKKNLIWVAQIDKEKKEIVFNSEYEDRISEVSFASLSSNIEVYRGDAIIPERFEKENVMSILSELSKEDFATVTFLGSCTMKDMCITRTCDKCDVFTKEKDIVISSKVEV